MSWTLYSKNVLLRDTSRAKTGWVQVWAIKPAKTIPKGGTKDNVKGFNV